ncbi:hypothetical protein MMC13_006779 [Lambiella insularis]|nr:hypothetical protein [Lambiella insularis]
MSDTKTQSLPPTSRALVCSSPGQPLTLEDVATPNAVPGSVIVRVLASTIEPATSALLAGLHPAFKLPTPFIPGSRAIARVAVIGPDTTSLQVGQLVLCEPFVLGRDNPDVQILWGLGVFGSDESAQKLMEGSWRNGMFAEYARAPLENCHALNEKILLGSLAEGGLGYSVAELTAIGRQLVAYGGFRGINLKAGETIIIAPSTGGYSGAAVEVASAMGARVIAVGRNIDSLKAIAAANARVNIVQLKGDVQEDLASLKQYGSIDAYLDISPFAANDSTHIRSCCMALKSHGRISLMGVIQKDIALPYVLAMIKNLTIRGQYMYENEDVRGCIKMVEAGVLKLGKDAGHKVIAQFPLDKWEEALQTAKQNPEARNLVVFKP